MQIDKGKMIVDNCLSITYIENLRVGFHSCFSAGGFYFGIRGTGER
jgi:hypothetical protein